MSENGLVPQSRIDGLSDTFSNVQAQINDKMKLVNGSEGEIYYFNRTSGGFSQTIMNEGFCCLTEEDVNLCKNQSPSFKEVFNTWKKFLKFNGYYQSFGMMDETNLDEAWEYGINISEINPSVFDNFNIAGFKNTKTVGDDGSSFWDLSKLPSEGNSVGDTWVINSLAPIGNEYLAIWTGTEWKRLPEIMETVYACKKDLESWGYDEEADTIIIPRNTAAPNGYISPKKYSSYDITVRCYSTQSDDDTNGLVACCAYDSDGVLHTLSFLRSPYANTNYKDDDGNKVGKRWVCMLDYSTFNLKNVNSSGTILQRILVDKTDEALAYYDDPQYNHVDPQPARGWNSPEVGVGTVINMTREGNIITAACSQFNSTVVDERTRIVIDLDALSEQYPVLNLFKGSSNWGYTTESQALSSYENIQIITPDLYIYDIPNNQVLYFDKNSRTWKVAEDKNPYDEIGAGRLSYNSVTKKLFYNGGTYVIQIGTKVD